MKLLLQVITDAYLKQWWQIYTKTNFRLSNKFFPAYFKAVDLYDLIYSKDSQTGRILKSLILMGFFPHQRTNCWNFILQTTINILFLL